MFGERPLDPFAARGWHVRQYQMLIGRDAHANSLHLRDDAADRTAISNRRLIAHSSAGNQDSDVKKIAGAGLPMPSQMIAHRRKRNRFGVSQRNSKAVAQRLLDCLDAEAANRVLP